MNEWLFEHVWATYAIIFILAAYVYNVVFRPGRLPLWKNVLIYALLAAGTWILVVFQMFGLPIVLCLLVAVALIWIVRIRYWAEARRGRRTERKEG